MHIDQILSGISGISGFRATSNQESYPYEPMKIRKKIHYVKNTELNRFEKVETIYDKSHGVKLPMNSKIIATYPLDQTGLFPAFNL